MTVDKGVNGPIVWQDAQERLQVLDWLTPDEYANLQIDLVGRRQAGTSQWNLDTAEFISWVDKEKQTLLCLGMPEAEKPVVTSVVIDHLTTRLRTCRDVGNMHLYYDHGRQPEQKTDDLLASILKQLVQAQTCLPGSLRALHATHKIKHTRPSFVDISSVSDFVVALYYRLSRHLDAFVSHLVLCFGHSGSDLSHASGYLSLALEAVVVPRHA